MRFHASKNQVENLIAFLDGFFNRVSDYAVSFHNLTKEQQEEVVARTFHGKT